MGFIHLHCHSSYSLSEGAIKAEKLAALAADAAMPALAITDTANLFGALEFAQGCAAKGVQPIMGAQLWLSRASSDARAESARLPPDVLVALAMDAQGLDNLQRLVSLSHLGEHASGRAGLEWDAIARHGSGLFLLTGGTHGPVARLLAEGRRPRAEALLREFREAFDGRLAVELHRHGTDRDTATEPGQLALADELALPIVAANDVYFARQAMHEAHDALLCIAESRTMAEPDRRRVTQEHWFKPADAMRALFHDLPDACDNTLAIARMCAVMTEVKKPALPICPKVPEGRTEAEFVGDMARAGLEKRLSGTLFAPLEEYRKRLEYELSVIEKMGFSGYFLIVADFIQWAKRQGIPVGPGRGSGAGSLAAWALEITDLDPSRFG